jgi:excinuclease ABC subunit B
MEERVKWFTDQGLLVEAERLKKRVSYDLKMIEETGFVNGIENYSPHFEKRLHGAPPNTLFDYFPDDLLVIVDESHMTIPQFG